MKTYWTAPGKGATVQELKDFCIDAPMAVDTVPAIDNMMDLAEKSGAEKRTNLAFAKVGVVEDYDFTRIKAITARDLR